MAQAWIEKGKGWERSQPETKLRVPSQHLVGAIEENLLKMSVRMVVHWFRTKNLPNTKLHPINSAKAT